MIKLGRNHPPGLIMNQTKLIVRFGVALLLLAGPFAAVASAAPSKADSEQTPARTVTVRGVVYDDQGQPLPGASVMVKGTTQGTVTDLDGRYTLNVRPDQTLVVSFMGFKDLEIPADGKVGAISLESDNVLDDAVVVGYGSTKKENLTGAVAVVDSKVFESRPIANPQQMLNGTTPNVSFAITDGHPARVGDLNIRGNSGNVSSIYVESDAATLVLIDGVEGDLAYINPDDIDSISILKDAASAAIYGSRGGFGVVLVTTKSGAKMNEGIRVNYSANFNISTPRSMPDLVTDGLEFAKASASGYFYYFDQYKAVARYQGTATIKADEYIKNYEAWYAAGNTEPVDASSGTYKYYGSTDWLDLIWKKYTTSQIHNLSVTGNTGKTSYSVSGRYYDYGGMYNGGSDTYNTYNLRTKVETELFPWLRLKENISYTHDFQDYGVASAGDGLVTPQSNLLGWGSPTLIPYNPDGTFTAAGWRMLSGIYGDRADQNFKHKTVESFKTTTALTASFFNNHLRLNADYSYQTKNYDVDQMYTNILLYNSVGVPTNALGDKNMYKQAVKEQFRWFTYQAANAYAEYENTFGKHYLKAMTGFNYETRSRRDFEVRKRPIDVGVVNPLNPWWAADGIDPYTGNDIITAEDITNKLSRYQNAGLFFRLNYNYGERYLIEFDGRYDGSSYFSKRYQWHFFPAVSAGWRVSQEPWWHINPAFISGLKIRASYGALGDAMSNGAYAYQETLGYDSSSSRVIDGISPVPYVLYPGELNSQYGWSTIKTFDVGGDLSFLNGKLDITGDYYVRRNLNMIVEGDKLASTFGSDSAKGNYADSSTYGWEVMVNYNNSFMVGSRRMNLGLRAGLADNYTVIDRYEGNSAGLIWQNGGSTYEGQVLGEIWGFRVNPDCPIFQTQEQIDNAFGQGVKWKSTFMVNHDNKDYKNTAKPGDIWIIDLNDDQDITKGASTLEDHGDLDIIGNMYGRYNFTFGFDIDYAGFFLSATFNGLGKKDLPLSGSHLMYSGYRYSYNPLTKWLVNNSWTEENTGAFMPHLSMPNADNEQRTWLGAKNMNQWSQKVTRNPIDRYLINGAYVNMQNVQFGYNIPKKVLSKINLAAAKIYFSGENLWNWSPMYKIYGRDFDVSTLGYGGDDYNFGVDWWSTGGGFQYPVLRTFSLGLSITFDNTSKRTVTTPAAASTALASALAAANAATEAAQAAADKARAEADALRDELAKALKAKDDCEASKDVKPMAVRRAEALHVEDIYFEINQSVIRDSETFKVDNLVKVLKANPTAKVSITGYADQGTGTEQRNYVLTKERAEVVAEALKAAGIGPGRISTEYYGTEKDSSWTPENNRVAVCIVND